MGLKFTPERKDNFKNQIQKVKSGDSNTLVIDEFVTEEEFKEIFELENLTSLDISFILVSKKELSDEALR